MAGKLRITGGSLRGRFIDVPIAADAGELRPTPDRVRAAIFSSLGEQVKDCDVLDVFAGSGIQAIEALSRGATRATFIELNSKSASVISKSCNDLKLSAQCEVVVGDAFKEIKRLPKESFDLVFSDPPYPVAVNADFWAELRTLLREDAIVVFRREKLSDLQVPDGYEVIREKVYGGTAVFFLRRKA